MLDAASDPGLLGLPGEAWVCSEPPMASMCVYLPSECGRAIPRLLDWCSHTGEELLVAIKSYELST